MLHALLEGGAAVGAASQAAGLPEQVPEALPGVGGRHAWQPEQGGDGNRLQREAFWGCAEPLARRSLGIAMAGWALSLPLQSGNAMLPRAAVRSLTAGGR